MGDIDDKPSELKGCRPHPGNDKALTDVPTDPNCRCPVCIVHRVQARRIGRCSEYCVVCFDAIDRGVNPTG